MSVLASSFVCRVSYVRAQTIVPEETIVNHVTWTASSSPYILTASLQIDRRGTLTIGPGVEVIPVDPSADKYDRPQIYVNGSLFLKGTAQAPIRIHDIYGISIDYGTTSIAYSEIDTPGGLNLVSSKVDIASSTIKNAGYGIYDILSDVTVTNSTIEHNRIGIFATPPPRLILTNAKDVPADIGGVGNAFDDSPILVAQNTIVPVVRSQVTISSSTFMNNSEYAIQNDMQSLVYAKNNWWGRSDGPVTATTSLVYGLVEYDPWIQRAEPCCSSVLFIPGIEGSRLYSATSIGNATTSRRLWEPHSNSDVSTLYLNSLGSSTNRSIYSGDPIDTAYGIKSVYGSFMRFMDTLSKGNVVSEWKAFGYDWRKPISEVVAGRESKATTSQSLIGIVEDMATRSRTGKVTLVAHSNGGLVAKYLMKTLVDQGKAGLIDSVIGVAVPYVGTPEAIPELLHGYNQSILKGLILKESTARSLAVNMPSAYSLLPSTAYFAKVLGPSIAFASTSEAGINNGSYAKQLSSVSAQNSFIADANNVRKNPVSTDTSLPIKGNQSLLASAGILHGILDLFQWPQSISHWSILGWNVPTTKTLEYSTKSSCRLTWTGMKCSPKLSYTASTTAMGDGTVVAPSAAYDTESVVSIDLKQVSMLEGSNISHANILESSTTQQQIKDIITHKKNTGSIPAISYGEPDYSKEPTFIVVRSSGPVDLNVYDSAGKHTGEIAPPAEVTDDVVTAYEENIPGSRYVQSDSGQNNSVYVPSGGGNYSIVAEGSGVGTFDLTVERVQGSAVLDTVRFDAIPVTSTSVASTTVTLIMGSSSIPLASSTAPLAVDISGDHSGTTVVPPNTQPDPSKYFDIFKRCIERIGGNSRHSKDVSKRIDHLQDIFRKKGRLGIRKGGEYESMRMRHAKLNSLSPNDKESLVSDIEKFVDQFE